MVATRQWEMGDKEQERDPGKPSAHRLPWSAASATSSTTVGPRSCRSEFDSYRETQPLSLKQKKKEKHDCVFNLCLVLKGYFQQLTFHHFHYKSSSPSMLDFLNLCLIFATNLCENKAAKNIAVNEKSKSKSWCRPQFVFWSSV